MERIAILFVFWLTIQMATSQEILTLDDAIQTALQNNLNIKIAKNNAIISENNAIPANAGLIPNLILSSGGTYQRNDSRSQDIRGEISEGGNVFRGNAAIGFDYVFFDGMGKANTFKKLKKQTDLASLNLQFSIENEILNVISQYYESALLSEQVDIAQKNLELSSNRLLRVQTKREFATATLIEELNAQVNYNEDSLNLANAYINYKNSKTKLNTLMGRNPDTFFEVEPELRSFSFSNYDSLKDAAISQNILIKLSELNIDIAQYDLKISKSILYPQISANANYGFNGVNSEIGFQARNKTWGFLGGMTMTYNIFDGGRRKSNIENAQLNIINTELEKKQVGLDVLQNLDNVYNNYLYFKDIAKIQGRNVTTATINYNRTEEQFKIGKVTSVEFREAQLNLARAENMLLSAQYNAQIAGYALLQITGLLLN
jgi:outer membrane protein TolC